MAGHVSDAVIRRLPGYYRHLRELESAGVTQISSQELGELAMEKLKQQDAVAYVRFASVYREFTDVETFMRELEELKN